MFLNKAKKKVLSVSPKQLESTKDCAYTDKSLKDCLDKGPADWVETDVYIKTANLLWAKFGQKVSGKVYFHRGSTFMDNIYKSKTKCHNIDKKSGNPQAPGSFSNDKWNPGDIWVADADFNMKELNIATVEGLNDDILDLYLQKRLVGISLKKVDKGVTSTEKNVERPPETEDYKYTSIGFTFGQTGDFFNSIDIYLYFSTGKMQLRATNVIKSWQGEIKGQFAAGGKIGGGNLNYYTEKNMKKRISSSSRRGPIIFRGKKE